MDELVVLYTTWPDAETAEAFARRALEQRLAACANILAPMRSIFRWESQIQGDTEVPMLLKTTAAAAPELGRLSSNTTRMARPACSRSMSTAPIATRPMCRGCEVKWTSHVL